MSAQADMFDGVFFDRASGHIVKFRDGRLVTHFKAGLSPPLAKRFGMAGPPDSYPVFPGSSALGAQSPHDPAL